MLRVGIIGCGKIADEHAEFIQQIPNCEIIGVCDKEELMAKQLYERFDIKYYFNDVNKLLDNNLDVIHITTSPQSHYELAKLCLNAGCNVYVEKPFTLYTKEADELIKLAIKKKLKITVGHNDQFSHAARRMRDLIKKGYLGDYPVHMESYYCYNLGDERYAKALIGDKDHWVRKLPGKLLQNIISHGIARISEFFSGDNPKVIAYGFASSLLKQINEEEIIDELRVIINDNDLTTAYFTFSTQMRPLLHQFRIFGNKNGLMYDHHQETFIKIRGEKYKSYLEKIIPPFNYSKQYRSNGFYNIKKFLKKDFHMKSGMKYLIMSFYKSISNDSSLPISYKEILLTSKIMDDIFSQLYNKD